MEENGDMMNAISIRLHVLRVFLFPLLKPTTLSKKLHKRSFFVVIETNFPTCSLSKVKDIFDQIQLYYIYIVY